MLLLFLALHSLGNRGAYPESLLLSPARGKPVRLHSPASVFHIAPQELHEG